MCFFSSNTKCQRVPDITSELHQFFYYGATRQIFAMENSFNRTGLEMLSERGLKTPQSRNL